MKIIICMLIVSFFACQQKNNSVEKGHIYSGESSLSNGNVPRCPEFTRLPIIKDPKIGDKNDAWNFMIWYSTILNRNLPRYNGIDLGVDSTIKFIQNYISYPFIVNDGIIASENMFNKKGSLAFIPKNHVTILTPFTKKNLSQIPCLVSKLELFMLICIHEAGHIEDFVIHGENQDDPKQYFEYEVKHWEREIKIFDKLTPGYLDSMSRFLKNWQNLKRYEIEKILEKSFAGRDFNDHDIAIISSIILLAVEFKSAKKLDEKVNIYKTLLSKFF